MSKRLNVNFKATETEIKKLRLNAKKFFRGNLSELVRTAGINYIGVTDVSCNKESRSENNNQNTKR